MECNSRHNSAFPLMEQIMAIPQIVIVGGGAGGLELATRLGRSLGRRGKAAVTLVDCARAHLWKPHLHQVASGSLDTGADAVEYLAHAARHGYRFRLGRMEGLDRAAKTVQLAALNDAAGVELVPRQTVPYDVLVVAVGSLTNDFGTPGVAEHCMLLDTAEQAQRFHQRLLDSLLRANYAARVPGSGSFNVTIVGGGATGVELAAELYYTASILTSYGLEHIDPERELKIRIVESAPRILAALPERMSQAVARRLRELNVEIHANDRVTAVTADGVSLQSGAYLPSALTVWSAGIRCPAFLAQLDGLEHNALNQLLVGQTLQTTRDPAVFALGDCAACHLPQLGRNAPPRAQTAHQQAQLLARSIPRYLAGKSLPGFVYRDFGSLVSLSERTSVGNLMGGLIGGSFFIEGAIAKLMYWSLYKMHQVAISGWFSTVLHTYVEWINRVHRPSIKLH